METHRNISETLGEDIISYKTAETWFENFKEENYNLDDKSHSGRFPLDMDDDITDVLEDELRSSVREVSSHTGASFATIFRHLKESGRTAEYGQDFPRELTDAQMKLKCELSLSLLSRKRSLNWIFDIRVLDNEEPLTDPKGELHQKKVMLSVWCDSNGVIYNGLFPDRATITTD
ncbi:hypothetical protein CRE_24259 [Caenorhabditis remanei]|uniref:Mos1 transposase HTH domain-containing protein n=1 Tax=Caenorhabditis remanei TaxID=31234 RepID=E3NHQ8_CAERE|nr:hypothetical protein CRE_24259 [Caenorhabditis remanei]